MDNVWLEKWNWAFRSGALKSMFKLILCKYLLVEKTWHYENTFNQYMNINLFA